MALRPLDENPWLAKNRERKVNALMLAAREARADLAYFTEGDDEEVAARKASLIAAAVQDSGINPPSDETWDAFLTTLKAYEERTAKNQASVTRIFGDDPFLEERGRTP